ncbi:MAG: DedA family protein [Thermodesulfovibrio sp.]|nr:DedA family protein [Thermodesulfovibrio sp.]
MDTYLLITKFSYIGLFTLLILGGLGVPFFPEDLILISCGMLISFDIIKPIPAIPIAYLGLVISDSLLYYAGRRFGRKIITNKRFEKIISPPKFLLLERKFIKHSTLIMLLGRLLVGFRAQVFLLAGITKVSFSKFLIIDTFGSAVVLTIMVSAGYIGGRFLENVKKGILYMEYAVAILAIVVIILLISYFSLKHLTKKYITGNNFKD